MVDDCIFCKIIKGEVPCSKVYEDDSVIAFLDIAPNNLGHSLVVPKEHHETIIDTPDETLAKLMTVCKKVGAAVMKATGCGGFHVNQNNFKTAGQLVPHIHFHIIPRIEGDGYKFWPHKEYAEGEMEEYMKRIKDALE
jgi:histidine triad (HIT) family protein